MNRCLVLVGALTGCDQVFDLTRPPDAFVEPDAMVDAMIDTPPGSCDFANAGAPYAVPSKGTSIIAGKFDSGDTIDLAVASTGLTGVRLLFTTNGAISGTADLSTTIPAHALAAGNLDQDTLDDIVAVTLTTSHVFLQTASSWDPRTATLIAGAPSSVAIANFDGVGLDDLVVAHGAQETLQVVLGGQSAYARGSAIPTNGTPVDVVIADVDSDLDLDIVAALESTNGVGVYLDDGANFIGGTPIATGLKADAVAVGRLGNRPTADMLVANRDANNVTVLRNNGNGAFVPESNLPVETAPVAIALADLDADGTADILVVNNKSNSFSVLRGTSTGFEIRKDYTTVSKPIAFALADLTGDGRLDVAVLGEDDGIVIHPTVCAPPL